jgi:hypothetical protein
MFSVLSRLIIVCGAVLISLTFLLILPSCEKEEYRHPVIHTGEVTGISEEGATFHGRIIETGSDKIVDHGFIFGPAQGATPDNTIKISLGKPAGIDFQHFSNHSLQKGETYFVRSFAVNENNISFFGRIVKFTSLGSLAPGILSIEPISGTWRDTLTVHGERLGAAPELVRVFINEMEIPLVFHSSDSLKVIVPDALSSKQSAVTVVVAGNSTTYEQVFTLKAPEVHQLSRDFVSRGDTVMVQGLGFHPQLIHNKVYLGDYEIELFGAESNTLFVRHGGYIPHGDHLLRVEVLGQQTEFANTLKVYEPWRQLNDPTWELGSILSYSLSQKGLVVWIDFMYPLTRRVYEYCHESDVWTPGGIQQIHYPEQPHRGFLVHDQVFTLNYNSGLLKYDASQDKWRAKRSMPIPTPSLREYSAFSIGNTAYVCGGQYIETTFINRVVSYNADTDSWSEKSNFPEPGFSNGISFSINGKGYAGLGRSHKFTPILNLYEYDPIGNNWTFKISLSGILRDSSHGRQLLNEFVINDKAYIFSGKRVSGSMQYNDFYEFDPAANTFRRLLDSPMPARSEAFSFSVAGKGYFGGGYSDGLGFLNDFWEFDPAKLPPASK